MENAKVEKLKCDIFNDFQTLWKSSISMWKPSDFQENPLVACKATFFESLKLWYKTLLMTFFFFLYYRMAFHIERRIITLVSWPFPNSLPFLVVFYSFWLSSWPFMLKSKLNIQFTNSSANSSIWTMNGNLFNISWHCSTVILFH